MYIHTKKVAICFFLSVVHCQGENNAVQTEVAPSYHTALELFFPPKQTYNAFYKECECNLKQPQETSAKWKFLRVIRRRTSDSQQLLMFEKVSKTKWTEGKPQYAPMLIFSCVFVKLFFAGLWTGGKLDYCKQEVRVHHAEINLQEWNLFWPKFFKAAGWWVTKNPVRFTSCLWVHVDFWLRFVIEPKQNVSQ